VTKKVVGVFVRFRAPLQINGEDVKFIAKAIIDLPASEDIGLANPTAFIMANGRQAINHRLSESRIILSQ
jgi:replication-associated recombination protein RarA